MGAKEKTVDLTIVRVEAGGNTGSGKYFYSFSPDIVTFRESGQLSYRLSADAGIGFRIIALVTTDTTGAIGPAEIAVDGRSVGVRNECGKHQLIYVSLVVVDESRDQTLINCDPQVVNIPD